MVVYVVYATIRHTWESLKRIKEEFLISGVPLYQECILDHRTQPNIVHGKSAFFTDRGATVL